MKKILLLFVMLLTSCATIVPTENNFVYLKDIDPTILQDMRYAGTHNFVGRPIDGYSTSSAQCILTREAATALSKAQQQLRKKNLSLMVFECFRPQRASNDFMTWSRQPQDQKMQAEFYPRVNKKDFFTLGYVAEKSGHSRGSSVDLTIVSLPLKKSAYFDGQSLVSCLAPYQKRYQDGGLDMGTGYDCMDTLSHSLNTHISKQAFANRMLLRHLMQRNGFAPYEYEWWHFSLRNEPYTDTYFDFMVK